jgi:hypothetical protein
VIKKLRVSVGIHYFHSVLRFNTSILFFDAISVQYLID